MDFRFLAVLVIFAFLGLSSSHGKEVLVPLFPRTPYNGVYEINALLDRFSF